MKCEDLTNKKIGRLTVLEFFGYKNNKVIWKCRCDCGNITYVVHGNLIHNSTKSCGCLQKELLSKRSITHNLTKTKIYSTWIDIKKRCYNVNSISYCNYGGRGITVCDEWKNDFKSFYNWSMQNGYDETLSIDRINNNGNYEPSNCRWVDRKTQNNNTRHNHYITYNGKTLTLAQWSEELGLTYSCLKSRINKHHWSIEKALTTPARK